MYRLINIFMLFNAVALMPARINSENGPIRQGITGHVRLARGSQMAMTNRAMAVQLPGIQREIYVYDATLITAAAGMGPLFSKVNSRLIIIAKSDSTGYYKVTVAAGKYSVFVKEGDKFFAGETDGNGFLNPVEVRPNEVTEKDITVNYRAAY